MTQNAYLRLASAKPLEIEMVMAQEWMEISNGIFVPDASTIERALRIDIANPRVSPNERYMGARLHQGAFIDGKVEIVDVPARVTNMMPAIVLTTARYPDTRYRRGFRILGPSYTNSILSMLSY